MRHAAPQADRSWRIARTGKTTIGRALSLGIDATSLGVDSIEQAMVNSTLGILLLKIEVVRENAVS